MAGRSSQHPRRTRQTQRCAADLARQGFTGTELPRSQFSRNPSLGKPGDVVLFKRCQLVYLLLHRDIRALLNLRAGYVSHIAGVFHSSLYR